MKKLCLLTPLLLVATMWAQTADQPDSAPPQQSSAPAPQQAQPQSSSANRSTPTNNTAPTAQKAAGSTTKGTSKDRLFFTLPNFLTLENASNVPPLTAGQKFKVTARGSFDPVELAWYGMLAGIAQWENDEPQYGQGSKGYAQRYGVRFADGTIENFMTKAIFPSLLHEDPRYFQSGKGGFAHRTGYAVSRIFVTRTDSGHNTFNFSEILGSATAAGISTYSYHSQSEHNVANVASVWGTQVAFDILSNVIKEFWPDVRRKIHPAKPGTNASTTSN